MKRTKTSIHTVIPVFRDEPALEYVVEQATIYSDEVGVCVSNRVVDIPQSVKGLARIRYSEAEGRFFRADAYSTVAVQPGIYQWPSSVIFLEASQVISDPHVVRDTLELNFGAILIAQRFFMWDTDNYRGDGIYAPLWLPTAGHVTGGYSWNTGYDTAPTAWSDTSRHIQAPFDVQDLRFLDIARRHDDNQRLSLRKYEGKILA